MATMARLNKIWWCQLRKQLQALQVSCHLYPPQWPWNIDPAYWLWKKGSQLSKPSACWNFSASLAWSTRPKTGCGARSASLWVYGNLFWQLSGDGSLHGSHSTTASPKPSSRAPWRLDDAVVSRGSAGWTTWKSGHSCPCQNCLLTKASCRKEWKRISAKSSVMSPQRSSQSRDWTDWTELGQFWPNLDSHRPFVIAVKAQNIY